MHLFICLDIGRMTTNAFLPLKCISLTFQSNLARVLKIFIERQIESINHNIETFINEVAPPSLEEKRNLADQWIDTTGLQ